MTDRELLEWAAKAAGMDLAWDVPPTPYYVKDGAGLRDWNPLTDDGDALRLSVKLGLLVYVMPDAGFTAIRLPGEHIGGKYDEVQTHDADPYAATRLAIVRAAASIGQSLETQSEKNARFRKALDEMPIAEPPHPPGTLGNTKPPGR
jgi:hypothetical protein